MTDLAAVLDRAARHLGDADPPVASWESGKPITVVLADRHQVFAEGLGMVLDAEDDIEVLGVAFEGHEALKLVTQHEPAILLLDPHLPRADLSALLSDIRRKVPATKIVMLSADIRRETVEMAMEAGADGFLAKDLTGWQVAAAIRKLLQGQSVPLTLAAPQRPIRDPSVELRIRTLSMREREILTLLVNGYSNRRIAEECFLSLVTVRTHVQNLLVKLGVHSKLEAVAFALEHQVVPLGGWRPSHSSTEQLSGSAGQSPAPAVSSGNSAPAPWHSPSSPASPSTMARCAASPGAGATR